MIIAIIGRKTGQADSAHEGLRELILSFARAVIELGHNPIFDDETYANFLKIFEHPEFSKVKIGSYAWVGKTADVAVVFGGDGTMLYTGKGLSNSNIPLLGVNLGRLGFITDVPHDFNYYSLVKMLVDKKYTLERRQMLDVPITWTNSKYLALNEVVISRSTGKVIEFQVFIDGEYAYQARGDGLMISTPTGSTAYALSTGAPIIHPSARVLEVIPIFPQTLSCRPLIVYDEAKVTFKLISGEATVFVDGTEEASMNVLNAFQPDRSSIIIQKSANTINFIHPKLEDLTYSYYHTLREKLNWQHLPGTPRT